MTAKKMIMLGALGTVPFVMVLGNSMLIPVLPAVQKSLKLSGFETSLIITLFSIPAGMAIPFSGYFSDRFSRKAVILPGLALYGLGGLIAGLAGLLAQQAAYIIVLIGRVLQGIGAAGTAPIAMALTGDLFRGKERPKALGFIEASNGFGKIVSPIIGSAVGLIAWFAPFFLFPVLNVLALLAVWLGVKEPEKNKQDAIQFNHYVVSLKKIFSKKTALILSSFLVGMVALLMLFGILFFLSDHLEQRYHLQGIIKGLALAIPVIFMTAASYGTGAMLKKQFKAMKALVVIGIGMITASLVILPCCRSTLFFFVTISVIGIGTGLVLPCLNTIITSVTDAEERGLVTSLYGSVRFFGVAAGPPIFSLLLGLNVYAMAWSAAVVTFITGISALFFIRVQDLVQPAPAR
ncbi:MAG: MFS transporter [Peptococcaceae bacterium]|nr:MFS transporter [Peptococcaceae bacterium]